MGCTHTLNSTPPRRKGAADTATTWVKLEGVVLREEPVPERQMLSHSPSMRSGPLGVRAINERRKGGCRGRRGRGGGEGCLMRTALAFCRMQSSRDGEGDGWLRDNVNVPNASAPSANTMVNMVIVMLRVLDSV